METVITTDIVEVATVIVLSFILGMFVTAFATLRK